jgi:hypothetical protein
MSNKGDDVSIENYDNNKYDMNNNNENESVNIECEGNVTIKQNEQPTNTDSSMIIGPSLLNTSSVSAPDICFDIDSDYDDTFFTEVIDIQNLLDMVEPVNHPIIDEVESLSETNIALTTPEAFAETLQATRSIGTNMEIYNETILNASTCEDDFYDNDDKTKDPDWSPDTDGVSASDVSVIITEDIYVENSSTDNEPTLMKKTFDIVDNEETITTSNAKGKTSFSENESLRMQGKSY